MQRIEPVIGNTDLSAGSSASAHVKALAKPSRMRKAILDWLVILFLAAISIAICGAFAVHAGLVPDQYQLGSPKLFERLLIVVGLAVVLIAQVVGGLLVFRFSFVQGGLSLFVPGYFFFALRRNGLYAPVIGSFCVGLLAVVAGTILLA